MAWFRRPERLSDDQLARLPELIGSLDRFDDAAHGRHAALTAQLLDGVDWTPARGMDLDEDMELEIAAVAAVLGVGLDESDPFANVSSVVVHAGTIIDRQPRPTPMRHVVTESPRALSGHTSAHGPVFVSWPAVGRSGGSVVLHEFAHKLDAASHVFDGTPTMRGAGVRERWIEVCTRVYEQLQEARDPVLRPYAAVNPAEFFAVVTEVFFVRPLHLRATHPDLYEVFAAYYGQDPAVVEETREVADDLPAGADRSAGPDEPEEAGATGPAAGGG